jgi:hypothetical protein
MKKQYKLISVKRQHIYHNHAVPDNELINYILIYKIRKSFKKFLFFGNIVTKEYEKEFKLKVYRSDEKSFLSDVKLFLNVYRIDMIHKFL